MASKHITIKDFDSELPGKIENGIYVFPKIETTSASKKRVWELYVILYPNLVLAKEDNLGSSFDVSQKLSNIKITKSYFGKSNDELENCIAVILSLSGQLKGKKTVSATYILTGKNIGKVNETNVVTQALRDAFGKYNKHSNKKIPESSDSSASHKIRYKPILVMHINDNNKPLEFDKGVYVQPKLDGVRCIAYFNNGNVELYSRNGKNITGFDHITDLLRPIFDKYPDLYLDGELYKKGLSLQTISGLVRSESNIAEKKQLQFNIFDCFIPCSESSADCPDPMKENNQTFKERTKLLSDIFDEFITSKLAQTYIKQVDTILVDSKLSDPNAFVVDYFDSKVKDNYEGIVIKRGERKYRYSVSGYRGDSMLKMKRFETQEFKIVGFTKGTKGIANGALMWICVTNDGKKEFNISPKNMDYPERKKLYNDYKKLEENGKTYFENNIKGKLLTVEFAEYSDDNVPIHGLGLTIRDYE